MRRILFSIAFAVASAVASANLLAEEPSDSDLSSLMPLERFAVDGFGTGSIIFGAPIDVLVENLGLPDQIKVWKESAYWNVDREQIPVEWIYSGFSAMTHFFRDGLDRTGPYHIGRTVIAIVVNSPDVELVNGLRVGDPISRFSDVLGEPRVGRKGDVTSKYHYYNIRVIQPARLNVDISLVVDSNDQVIEIAWSPAPAH